MLTFYFIFSYIFEIKKEPETVKEIIYDYARRLFLAILNLYGIQIPSTFREIANPMFLFKVIFIIFFTLGVFFYLLFNIYNIYIFIRKVTGKIGFFMENKIILHELLIIYNFIDYIIKKILHGFLLMVITAFIYFILCFFELWFIVNFSYYCLGLKDFVTVFIYRV